jgi:hypothetical protein
VDSANVDILIWLRASPELSAPVSSHRYIADVPPCFDVYVWVRTGDRPGVLSRFIDRYIDVRNPGEPRFDAFMRRFVREAPAPGDHEAPVELRRDASGEQGFSLYLHAKYHQEAIITITEEGDLVLGLGLDDPDNSPEVWERGHALMASLRAEFSAIGGVGGVELPPAQSASEWADNALVQMREGTSP